MPYPRFIASLTTVPFVAIALVAGCRNKVPPPEPDTLAAAPAQTPDPAKLKVTAASGSAAVVSGDAVKQTSGHPETPSAASSSVSASQTMSSQTAASPAASVTTTTTAAIDGDPLQGRFTLQDATKGLPKTGKLYADIATDSGTLKCEMYEDKAPNTVANFVGLARGIRPFKDPKTGVWGKRPGYDNGVFHRIIKGFMIQGGDPTGTGATDGGYVIPDEVWPGASHNRRGLICMANRGKDTNSMQFFITDGPAPHLDRGYTIFGSCGPDSVIEKLASVEVRGDRAVNPPKIKKVTVRRGK